MKESNVTTIAEWVGRLETVLESEEDLYRRFRTLLRREESELIGLEPNTLANTLAEKRALTEEARIHEESRLLVTESLAALLGFAGPRPKLSEIIASLGYEAGELPTLHGRLSALIAATRSLLSSNERFASRSLGRVQETLKLLGQAVPEESGYGPGGHRSAGAGRGRLVRATI